MTRRTRNSSVAAAVFAGGLLAVGSLASLAWNRATARAVERMATPGPDSGHHTQGVYSGRELYQLPAPVARYFEFALTPGQSLIRGARVEQTGEFASEPGRWAPFTAVEHFSVRPPGFVWDARIRMFPLVDVRVRDSYHAGRGVMHGAIAGLVTVVDERGTAEMGASTLLRYLAETAWIPTALLPASGVHWEPIDDRSARASLTDAGITVSMDVRFGVRGEIVEVSALRHRDVNGEQVLTPWRGHFGEYRQVDGMMVPGWGEVGWVMDGVWTPYWRGRNTAWEFVYLK